MKLLDFDRKHCNKLWWRTDSESLYNHNLGRMPDDWIWRTTKVTYTTNSQGYRCPEWNTIDWQDSILVFGCSFVFGVGVGDSHNCTAQLASMINKPVINLGVVGSSPMFQWANTARLVKENVKPRAVIYVWPAPHRFAEFIDDNFTRDHGPWTKSWLEWSLHESQGKQFLRHAIWSVDAMWNCPVLHYHTDPESVNGIDELKHLDLGPNDHARDWDGNIAHPGIHANRHWATIMSRDLNGLW